ncbi:MAG: hypothetical protein IJH14_04850, partial [Solobacterium sp.]|nr:hypothetical protein [Solobacterium sp.]
TEGAPMPKVTTVTATADNKTPKWEELHFEKAGTYEYTITEQKGTADGVTYDTTPHKVVVTVTKDADNKLSATVKYDDKDKLTITNTFKAVEVNVKATKKLEGREWADDDNFSFELTAVTKDAPMPSKTTAAATKNAPEAVFETIKFDKAGTYEYTVKEVLPDGVTEENPVKDGITYDTKDHKVTVKVTKADDATNALTATVTYEEEAGCIITNKYSAEGSAYVLVQKVLNGREWTEDDSFTFTISAEEGTPLPTTTTLTITKETLDHLKSFDKITFTKEGTYTYTVKETKGDAKGMTYDTSEHTITFNAIDDGKGNIVPATEDETLIKAVTITNTYTEVKVEKVDDKNKAVKGAVLAIKDKDGKVVAQWTTDGTVHSVDNLEPDSTYTLTEIKVPEGYKKAADITFTTGPDGGIQVIKMVDKQEVIPDTSDHNNATGWTAGMITSMLVAIAAFLMKKKYSYR